MPTNEETLGYHSPIIPGMDQEGEKLATEFAHDDTLYRATRNTTRAPTRTTSRRYSKHPVQSVRPPTTWRTSHP